MNDFSIFISPATLRLYGCVIITQIAFFATFTLNDDQKSPCSQHLIQLNVAASNQPRLCFFLHTKYRLSVLPTGEYALRVTTAYGKELERKYAANPDIALAEGVSSSRRTMIQ